METDQRPCLSNDEKSSSSLKRGSCDEVGDDILRDAFFDHSRPLEESALEALLNTKFNTSFDDVEDTTSVSTAQWRPAYSETLSQQRSPSTMRMELSSLHEKHDALPPAQSSSPFASYRPAAQVTANYHILPSHAPSSNSFEQHSTLQQPNATSFDQSPTQISQSRYYSTSGPVAMPTMNDVYPDPPTQTHQFGYYSPSNASRQGTADLMDYENTIPEEEEAGETVNGEIADPCYAQLLYRCLRDAPDHTMALKDVYKWVRQYSQKARDSAGTGWQNSVRHNLSMNAVSFHESSSNVFFIEANLECRLLSASPPLLSTAQRRARSGVLPVKRSKTALSRPHAIAKTQSASRSAATFPLKSGSALVQRVDRRLAQRRHTKDTCKLVRLVCRT